MRRLLLSLSAIILCQGFARNVPAAQPTSAAAALFPPTTVLFVEVPQPAVLLETVYTHPVTKRIESAPQYQQALQSQLLPVRTGLAFVEFGMQMNWREILAAVTQGGVAIGIDGETGGSALLLRARDAETLTKLRNVLLNLTRDQAKRAGGEAQVKSSDYRGFAVIETGGAKFAYFDEWLLVTNNDAYGKQILDQYADSLPDDLAASAAYQQARASAGESAAWAYLDVDQLRKKIPDPANPLRSGKADNPAGEILAGGVLANLRHTAFVAATLQLDAERLRLAFHSPHDPSWVGEEREHFFGPEGHGQAPQPLEVPQQLGVISAYRDFSSLWMRAGDLFSKEINDKFAEADATLATLFSGHDFGEEILGAIKPEFQLLFARQTFDDAKPVPTIKLPAFALIAELKDAGSMQREFRRMFQNLIGFLNVVGAMNGQPQLDLDMEQVGGHTLITSTYVPDVDQRPGAESRINFNFSPTLAFVDSHVVVSSTTPLARAITERLGQPQQASAPLEANTHAHLQASALRDLLHDNLGQLVAQNVLEKGHSHEQAEKELQGLLEIISLFRSAKLNLAAGDQLRLTVDLDFAAPPAP